MFAMKSMDITSSTHRAMLVNELQILGTSNSVGPQPVLFALRLTLKILGAVCSVGGGGGGGSSSSSSSSRSSSRSRSGSAQQTNCPNLVAFHGAYLDSTRVLLALEYVGGGSVQDLVDDTGPLREVESKGLARDVLSALSFLQERGILHRDVKVGDCWP